MQFTIAVVAAFAASTYAQMVTPSACLSQAEAVPTCALSCISSAASRAGCGQYDLACQCGTASAAINSYAEGCVIAACTPISNALAVASSAAAVCSCVATAPSAAQAGTTTTTMMSGSTMMMTGSPSAAGSPSAVGSPSAAASQQTDGQVTASSAVVVTQISDGQPQATSASIVTGGAATLGALGGVAGAILGVAALL